MPTLPCPNIDWWQALKDAPLIVFLFMGLLIILVLVWYIARCNGGRGRQ